MVRKLLIVLLLFTICLTVVNYEYSGVTHYLKFKFILTKESKSIHPKLVNLIQAIRQSTKNIEERAKLAEYVTNTIFLYSENLESTAPNLKEIITNINGSNIKGNCEYQAVFLATLLDGLDIPWEFKFSFLNQHVWISISINKRTYDLLADISELKGINQLTVTKNTDKVDEAIYLFKSNLDGKQKNVGGH